MCNYYNLKFPISRKRLINTAKVQKNMEGKVISFRRGARTQRKHQMVIRIDGVENKNKAESLIGKSVTWISLGKLKKEIKGQITNTHGNKGTVRVQFERGLPGQSVGTKVNIN